jgi:fructan beta-fructosidase
VSGSAGSGGDGGTGATLPAFPDDANFPYVITNYDEPFRGQVHFSAPMGWLNDSNGMWFDRGLYHFSYQAYPYELGGAAKHWGHASSPDLVHWTHWPIMLDPELVPGDAWSGSTVVDTNNTSGLQTGEHPVYVTLYTATSLGTCVAYSNDQGVTWQAYEQNPVAIGGPNADTRDPHVFWHEPTQKWVCALYEDEGGAFGGTSFYGSADLLSWTKTSHIDFGFECPDLFELPIDGDATNSKWVLQDAAGSYLLGAFDGNEFVPDSPTPLAMDASSDFYAAQTFYRQSFPDQRVVQMPWVRGMDGATAPWNQVIGLPVSVELKTFPSGVRVARTPVAEIESLRGDSIHLDGQAVAGGVNPFAALQSKVFDLEVELDLGATNATSVEFRLADLTFTLDLAAMEVFGTEVSAPGDHVRMRILRDWGQYEVFVNDGEVVYTGSYPFDPADASLAMTGDGVVGLASADFHPLGRAWPGEAALASAIIDDQSPSVTYEGEWQLAAESRYFASSAHYNGPETGTAFEVAFEGTRVEWYGLKNVDLGRADVYLDGSLVESGVEAYSARRQNALLFSRGQLENAAHVLRVEVMGQKDPASSGTALVHDYIVAYVDP